MSSSTPTFSYRNGEYFKDDQPLDVLLELCELTGEIECYEEMKEEFGLRIADLEKEIIELKEYREHHEFVMQQVQDMIGKPISVVDDYIRELVRLKSISTNVNS